MYTTFERLFYFNEFKEVYFDKISTFIFAKGKDDRCDIINSKVGLSKNSILVEFLNECDEFIVSSCNSQEEVKYSITSGMDLFLDKILEHGQVLFIDITGMSIRFLASMLARLRQKKCQGLFCAYTEPKEYIRKKSSELFSDLEFFNINNIFGGSKHLYSGRFNLYSKFKGIDSIPGLVNINHENNKVLWSVLLGFEGSRAMYIFDQLEQPDKIIPIITLPAFKPGWQDYAFEANIDFFRESESIGYLDYLPANSPFPVYDYFVGLKKDKHYNDYYIKISPLGTRPNALGAILFALENDKCEIVFDNPSDSKANSVMSGSTYVYDISNFFK